MRTWEIWKRTTAGMLAGRRFSPKQIEELRRAVWEEANDGRVEVMLLFFAEALHDVLGYGYKRTARILHWVNDHMQEWTDKVNAGEWDIDDLRIRVFEKTGFMFALNKQDQMHIVEVLNGLGHKVTIDEPEEEEHVPES